MKLLHERGINIYAQNQNGTNALHIAVKKNNLDVLRELVLIKYDLNTPKKNGLTAASIAAFKGFK
jgi:ankyrin repeat protein